MRLFLIFFAVFAIFVCHSNADEVANSKQEVETLANLVIRGIEKRDISKFLDPNTSETDFLERYYTTPGLLGLSSLKCTRLQDSKVTGTKVDATNETAEVEFETDCVTLDKGYLAHNKLNFKKLDSKWRVYLK